VGQPSTVALLISVFTVVLLAELPDKTAIATLVLATRHKAWVVFAASASALVLQSAVAVAAGGLLAALPRRPVALTTGLVFFVSAVVMWRKHEEPPASDGASGPPLPDGRAFLRVFTVIFAAEWGDLTQLGTAALAARYARPIAVFVGSTLALWCVAGLAAFAGHRAKGSLDARLVQRAAAVLFALVGVWVVKDYV
jgi:Ca2+/H+ antiporter, TMEM165/GDT1 family